MSSNSSVVDAAEPPTPMKVDSDVVVILAALLCALVCVVGLFAVSRCTWLRRSNAAGGGTSHQIKGLKKKVIQSLPKLTFKSTLNVRNLIDCAICLTEFVDGDQIRVLPQCGHGFHIGCIDTWLVSHSSCPSCRKILVVSRCKKCGLLPASSAGDPVDLEVGFKAAIEVDTPRFLP